MTFRMIPVLATTVFLSAPSLAADPASVLAALGISGTWAPACSQPPSPQSPHVTFVPADQGQVTIRMDAGQGYVLSTLLTAASSTGAELQTTTLTSFDNIPKPMREAFEKDHMHPDITMRTTYSVETKGVLVPKERTIQVSTLSGEAKMITNGFNINPANNQPTQKAQPLLKCSN